MSDAQDETNPDAPGQDGGTTTTAPPPSWAGASLVDVKHAVAELKQPTYRADQFYRWVHKQQAEDFDAMGNLPRALRDQLAAQMPVRSTKIRHIHESDDQTTKLLLELADGETVECVLIPEGERRTACLSTQVGCGVGCVFCASGADGVIRNLSAGEIVEQLFWLQKIAGDRMTHVVIMGMGEPLHNTAALVAALRVIQSPAGVDLSARRITVSTSGPRRGFDEFLQAGLQVKLAISLHSVHEDQRKELVPRGGSGTIEELQGMAQRWFDATGRDVTYEYVLLGGINDSDGDARLLGRICGPHRNVNVIPMNPVPFAPDLRAPAPVRVQRFIDLVTREGGMVHARRQRGDDVAAACGQLRLSRTSKGR